MRGRLRLRWWGWVLVGLVVAGGGLALNFWSARSEFCGSCHTAMGSHYASWSASSHSSVKCLDCHSDPGWVGYYHSKADGVRNALEYFLGIHTRRRSEPPGRAACQRPGCHSDADLTAVGLAGAETHARHRGSVACVSCHGDVGHRDVAERRAVVPCSECHPSAQTP